MDVDYTTNIIQAVNQAQIISGSATRAAVQDSNYATFTYTSPRYIGQELSSAKLNEWTFGDISYGKVPNVSNPEINFVSFKSLNGTSPQWGNNNVDLTQVNVEYIIDADLVDDGDFNIRDYCEHWEQVIELKPEVFLAEV